MLIIVPLLLISIPMLAVQTLTCPAPFSPEAERCVFVNASQSYSWCAANQRCALLGGELINSFASLKLMSRMPSLNSSGRPLWLGLSDLPDERDSSRSGWQMINDHGELPLDDSLWKMSDPSNAGGVQDCVSESSEFGRIADLQCSTLRGFACELTADAAAVATAAARRAAWQLTPFKRTSFNPSSEYCHADLPAVRSAMHCVAAAMRAGNARRVLYNAKLRLCRLLQFTDSHVEREIETSADWAKYSVR